MFTKISQLIFCMAMLVLPATLYGAQKLAPPVVKDFRYIYPLSGEAGANLYRVSLPSLVYTYSQQPDLHDLRVFDIHGVAMPMYISKVADAPADAEHSYPAFRMRVAEQKGQITLLGGQIPIPAPQAPSKADSPTDRRETDAILFDFSASQHRLTDLRLIPEKAALPDVIGPTKPEGAVSGNTAEKGEKGRAENSQPQTTAQATGTGQAGYVVSARLYTSDNMVKWYDEGLRSFGRIHAAGQMLDLLTLNVSTSVRYMLVVPVEGAHFFAVEGVSGIEQNRTSRMNSMFLDSNGWDDKAGGYLYTLSPSMSVRALSLYLPDTTWLLRAEILTRAPQGKRRAASQNPPWQTRTSGVFYSLKLNGTTRTSESVTFSPEWVSDDQKPDLSVKPNLPVKPNLLVRPKGAAWSKAPTLKVSFEDQEVYFMAAGPGPYRVAIGSSVPMPIADGPDAAVLKSLEGQATVTLHLGDMQEQLFAADVQKGPSIFIWGALLLGALCMGGIALHMLRSQRASKD